MTFSGKRLKAARQYTFKTMDVLKQTLEEQHNLKVTRGMISRWENGKAIPREENIEVLSSCLKVTKDYLTGKASFNNVLKYLRFVNNLTIDQLSKISGVSIDSLSLVEDGVGYLNQEEFDKVEKALNIGDLRSIAVDEGINFEPLTLEEHQWVTGIIKGVNERQKERKEELSFFQKTNDLFFILDDFDKVFYSTRLLTGNERNKIKKLIEVFLENEDEN